MKRVIIHSALFIVLVLQALPVFSGQARDRFEELDRNGDGRISAEEAGNSKQFKKYDLDGDGFVTAEEIRRARNQKAGPSPSSSDTGAIAGEYREAKNQQYAKISGVDPNSLSLDIYMPAAASSKKLPVLVMVHGGGWAKGDKANADIGPRKAKFFVPMGYVYVALNYRLSPAVKHPTHVQDIAHAIDWVSKNIDQFGGDPEQVVLIGHSAGAHLVSLLSTDDRYLAQVGKKLGYIKGVILLDSAAYDIPRLVQEKSKGKTLQMYEQAFGTDRAVWRDASPVNHIAPGKGIPPFLVAYRERIRGFAEPFINSLQAAGTPVQSLPVNGKSHEEMKNDLGKPGDVLTIGVTDFLRRPH
jgi:acetyl esterase/lipase